MGKVVYSVNVYDPEADVETTGSLLESADFQTLEGTPPAYLVWSDMTKRKYAPQAGVYAELIRWTSEGVVERTRLLWENA